MQPNDSMNYLTGVKWDYSDTGAGNKKIPYESESPNSLVLYFCEALAKFIHQCVSKAGANIHRYNSTISRCFNNPVLYFI